MAPTLTRWHALVACLYTGTCTGWSYAFGVWGGAMKKEFNFSQPQLNSISCITYVLGLVSWIPGLIADRKGSTFATYLGGTVLSAALLLMWTVCTKALHTAAPQAVLTAAGAVSHFGSSLLVAATFSNLVRNFPAHKGVVIGLAKGWVGLCGGLLTQIYAGFFGVPDDSARTLDFILFLAVAMFVAAGASAPFIRVHPAPAGPMSAAEASAFWSRINTGFTILLLTGVAVTTMAAVSESLSSTARLTFSAVILLLWLAPVLIVVRPCMPATWRGEKDRMSPVPMPEASADREGDSYPLVSMHAGPSELDAVDVDVDVDVDLPASTPTPKDGLVASESLGGEQGGLGALPSMSLPQMLRAAECYLLLFPCVVGVGSGIFLTTNAAQICEAKAMTSRINSAFVTLFSVSQALGRVTGGLLPDFASRWRVQRPLFLAAAAGGTGAGHLLLAASSSEGGLFLGVVLAGVGFGLVFPLMVVLTSELFGLRHHGANYMFIDGICASCGTLVLAKFIPQTVYKRHISDGSKTCIGPECFGGAHFSVVALCAAAMCTSLVLSYRTRRLYHLIWSTGSTM